MIAIFVILDIYNPFFLFFRAHVLEWLPKNGREGTPEKEHTWKRKASTVKKLPAPAPSIALLVVHVFRITKTEHTKTIRKKWQKMTQEEPAAPQKPTRPNVDPPRCGEEKRMPEYKVRPMPLKREVTLPTWPWGPLRALRRHQKIQPNYWIEKLIPVPVTHAIVSTIDLSCFIVGRIFVELWLQVL